MRIGAQERTRLVALGKERAVCGVAGTMLFKVRRSFRGEFVVAGRISGHGRGCLESCVASWCRGWLSRAVAKKTTTGGWQ